MAEIGWIDFSNKDRKKAHQLLSLIRPEGQLDELGVGYLRDALANQLFPGISTIQTRAKYFFIIPNILREYQKLQPKEKRHTTPRQFLKEEQHKVKNALREKYNYEEGLGIIGVTLQNRQYVKRNPSEIYWNGLQVYSFMNEAGLSQEQYLRNVSAHQPLEKSKTKDEKDDADSNYEDVLHINTPVNNYWFEELSIELDQQESDFFSSQILHVAAHTPNSLLPQLLKNKEFLNAFLMAEDFQQFVPISFDFDFKPEVKQLLTLSHDFAFLMEGLHLLYNHLLQEHFFTNDYDNHFETEWQEWRNELESDMQDFENFSPELFYQYTRYRRINTELFVNAWWKLVKESKRVSWPTIQMKEIVKRRELATKGKKSRLCKPVSSNTDVTLHKRIGLSLFQYRFFNVKTILTDIVNPV